MIEQLPIYEDDSVYNMSEPLLDYVRDFSNNYWKNKEFIIGKREEGGGNISPFPSRFAKRLNENDIQKYRLNDYLKAITEYKPKRHIPFYAIDKDLPTTVKQQSSDDESNISMTLRAYNLDASKFWYLCLMIRDYIEGVANMYSMREVATHRDLINQLIESLDLLDSPENNDILTLSANTDIELVLRIKKKGNSNFRKVVNINDIVTLRFIRVALRMILLSEREELDFPVHSLFGDGTPNKKIGSHFQLSLFYRYLMWFLNKQEVDKEFANNSLFTVSVSKNMLISRMAYYTGLTDDVRFLTQNGDYLRAYISGYEDTEDSVLNYCYELPEEIRKLLDPVDRNNDLKL